MDLTIYCDVARNPGPDTESNYPGRERTTLCSTSTTKVPGIKYSKSQLYSLRKHWALTPDVASSLKTSGLFCSRGTRAGRDKDRNNDKIRHIPCVSPSSHGVTRPSPIRSRDTSVLRMIPYQKRYKLPVVLSTNQRRYVSNPIVLFNALFSGRISRWSPKKL